MSMLRLATLLFVSGVLTFGDAGVSALLANERSQCRAGYVPSKNTYSTCRAKFINICGCECRDVEGTENLVCRAECHEKAICDTCLRYSISSLETDESNLSIALCDVSTRLLENLELMKSLKGKTGSEEFSQCQAEVVRKNLLFTSEQDSLSTQLDSRFRLVNAAFEVWECAVSSYGQLYKEKNEIIFEHTENRRQFWRLSSRLDYINRYKRDYTAAGQEIAGCTLQDRSDLAICGAHKKINDFLKYEAKFE